MMIQPLFFTFSTVICIITMAPSTTSTWASWESWSKCSRTCGGGVTSSRRRCAGIPGNCKGLDVRYRTCENQACIEPTIDFRALQCAAYDDTEFEGKFYSWIPEVDDNLPPCSLYCRARNTEKVLIMSPKVADGTRCYKQSEDVCINGTCQPVGCDHQLNSDVREDVCGICGGDGSSCRFVTGLYRSKPDKNKGTEVVINIPQNSRHISVSERGSGHLGLLLNDTSHHDVIMTNHTVRKGVIKRPGLLVNYGSLSYGKEYFDVPGPVPKNLQVLAMYDDSIWKYIRYEFYRPLEAVWIHDEDAVLCTATCGGGLQYIWPVCADASTGDRTDDKRCHKEGLTPPAPKVHRCNTNKCPESYVKERRNLTFEYVRRTRWLADPWTKCSASCKGGIQTRSISCVEDTIDGRSLVTSDDSPCHKANLPLPESRKRCNEHSCPRWETHNWSQCSVTCGSGWQHRIVRCISHHGKAGYNCDQNKKPSYRQNCLVRRACLPEDVPAKVDNLPSGREEENAAFMGQEVTSISILPSWISGSWGDCSVTCGVGFSVRQVRCQALLPSADAVVNLPNSDCVGDRPSTTQPCSMGDCPRRGISSLVPSPARNPIFQERCRAKKCGKSRSRSTIHSSDEDYIQQHPQTKVRLQIGQKAFILPKTIVIIKCRVDDFKKANVRWRYNGKLIVGRNHVTVLSDASLRILRAKASDSGRYSCHAGTEAAHSVIEVAARSNARFRHTQARPFAPNRPRKFYRKSFSRRTNSGDDDVYVDVIEIPGNGNGIPHLRERPLSIVTTTNSLSRLVHPELTYAAAAPLGEIVTNTVEEQDLTSFGQKDFNSNQDLTSSNTSKDSRLENVFRIVRQFMHQVQNDPSSSLVPELLQQFMETAASYENGEIDSEQRNITIRSVLTKLKVILNSQNTTLQETRGNENVNVTLQIIIDILQDQTTDPDLSYHKGASIIPQPTLPLLHLGRRISTYVGGALMVSHAERITILCEASGVPKPEIMWFKNGNRLPEHERQFMLPDGSLRLIHPQVSDAGSYRCVASNPYGNDSQSTELSFATLPRVSSTATTVEDYSSEELDVIVGSNVHAKLGARVRITCPTEGSPDPLIVWRKDGSQLGENAKVLPDNSIEIYPATPEYQGIFGCEASNPAGRDYRASSLVLIDPPHIIDSLNAFPLTDVDIELPEILTSTLTPIHRTGESSSVTIGCPISGLPEPSIRWFFNDQPITELGTTLDYQLLEHDKILHIPIATSEAEGVYTCRATNQGGHLTTKLDLRLTAYMYELGEVTECSASCGDSGVQHRRVKCTSSGGVEVTEAVCGNLTKPTSPSLKCNRIDCPPSLVFGAWKKCSAVCGSGTRSRASRCVVLMSDGSTREVAMEMCERHEHTPSEPCYERQCPKWRPGPWRACGSRCIKRGVGIKTRKVYCVKSNGTRVHPKLCGEAPKPRGRAPCLTPRCSPVWVASRWSSCSKSCGKSGFKTRLRRCVYAGIKRQSAGKQCFKRRAPRLKLPCNRRRCGAGSTQSRSHPLKAITPQGRCVDRYSWCPLAARRGECRRVKKLCCRSCPS